MSAPGYVQRMRVELDELAERVGKLTNFLAQDPDLPSMERVLLAMQLQHMMSYKAVLNARLMRAGG